MPPGLSLSADGVLSGTPTQAGSFSLSVQAQDAGGCVGISPYTLLVSGISPSLSLANISVSPASVCVGVPVSFTATVANVTGSYAYTLTNGASTTTGSSSNPAYSQSWLAAGSGSQSFTLTVSSAGQSATATTALLVNPLPTPTLTASNESLLSCGQTSLTLTAGGGTTYVFGEPGVASQSGNTALVNAAGLYSVTVVSASGCSSVTSISVSQDNTVPAASLVSSGSLNCGVTSVTLTAGPGGQSYVFSTGAAQIGNTNQAVVTITGANGCTTVAQTTVSGSVVEPLAFVQPPASASSVAVGASVTTTVSVSGSGPLSYQWYKDNLANPVPNQNGATLTLTNVQLTDAGSYSVVVTGACGIGTPTSLTSTAFTLAVTAPNPLQVTLGADPVTLVAGGATSLSATVSGGSQPYAYRFSGPGVITPAGATAQVTDLPVGVHSFTVVVSDATSPASLTSSATVSVTVNAVNTAPSLATAISSQTATVGQSYSLNLAGTFTDQETPNSLSLSASGLPAGLSLVGTTLSGTPSVSGVSTVVLIATDRG